MKMIVLANSRKLGNRCLAGINPETGEWIRPVHTMRKLKLYGSGNLWASVEPKEDGGVDERLMRSKLKKLPKLLDIIDIPLEETGPDFGVQPENREIEEGEWSLIGRSKIGDLDEYVEKSEFILHNNERALSPDKAREKLPTLQLIKTEGFKIYQDEEKKRFRLRGIIQPQGLDLPITDIEYEERIRYKGEYQEHCFLTVSLGELFDERQLHYKLIAGVIEIEGGNSNG